MKSCREHGGSALFCTTFSNERSGGMDLLCFDVLSTYAWHEDTVIGPGAFSTKAGRPCWLFCGQRCPLQMETGTLKRVCTVDTTNRCEGPNFMAIGSMQGEDTYIEKDGHGEDVKADWMR